MFTNDCNWESKQRAKSIVKFVQENPGSNLNDIAEHLESQKIRFNRNTLNHVLINLCLDNRIQGAGLIHVQYYPVESKWKN